MTRFFRWLTSLRRPIRWLVGGGLLLVTVLVAVTVSATTWEYTNSPQFCGTTCHTMPPEYTAYQVSPHARVACVDCHLGQDSVLLTVPRKAREFSHVINALTQAYEPPIYVKALRPARDTCEQCHNPEKASSDSFVEIKRFASDEQNTETRNYMIIKTGGGTLREGLGQGIHWHIQSQVYFYTDDPLKQTIPYVKTIAADGKVTEYFDAEAGLPPDFGSQVESQLHRMDCIDCHTRISHLFRSPDNAMDDALARGAVDPTIPYIKQQGVKLLSQEYTSTQQGEQAIEGLVNWYATNVPAYYAEHAPDIIRATGTLKKVFDVTVFPNLKVGWQTHPDNAGHREFPGCFRCHDGKHISPSGQTVRLECNVCHSIPEIVQGPGVAPVLSVDTPGEPDSHKDSNWLARHRYVFDASCAACHDVSNPGGTDNSSFCSNSACHATEWKFVGLSAPAIRLLVAPPSVPGSGEAKPVPHPVGDRTDCLICHAPDAVHPFPQNHTSFTRTMCTQCHAVSVSDTGESAPLTATPSTAAVVSPPAIPHTLEGRRDQCLTCHGKGGFKPFPANHVGRTTDTCLGCHQPVESSNAAPAATATVAATGIPGVATPEPPAAATATTAPATATSAPTLEVTATAAPTLIATATSAPTVAATATAAATPAAGAAPTIPHGLAGRENQCLVCHATGSLKPFPENHAGRGNDSCLLCHTPQG